MEEEDVYFDVRCKKEEGRCKREDGRGVRGARRYRVVESGIEG